tara:strand:- start:418 stop:528 length:111 start_codon:yes stop_codon:yes gene_type:complete
MPINPSPAVKELDMKSRLFMGGWYEVIEDAVCFFDA